MEINEYDVDSLRLKVEWIEKSMRERINVKPSPRDFYEYIMRAKQMIEPHYVTFMVYRENAVVIPIPLWRKGEINVRETYYKHYVKDNTVLINHPAIRGMLRKLAIKYLGYSDGIETYTLNTRDPSTREFIIKLLIYNALYDFLWDKYTDLWENGFITLSYAYRKLWDDLDPTIYELDHVRAFNLLLKIISKKSIETLRSVIANIVENRVRWLRKKLELHYIVSHAAKEYIKDIRHAYWLSSDRALTYLRRYRSYVEYDGKTLYYRLRDPAINDHIVFLSGIEDNNKFVRIKVDILSYRYGLKLQSEGSWIIGFDKLTRQPFSISLPYTCITMPIKPCIEYVFGLRHDNLERINEDVEIYET